LFARLQPLLAADEMPVHLVGGAVRDALLGHRSDDLDFVAPGQAISLAYRVGDALSLPAYVLDRERDTGRVVVPAAMEGGRKITLDFARYRAANLDGDLRARDFTINAMALPASSSRAADIVDPLGGRADLEAGLVRQTHPDALLDDPVRTLRAVRMAVRFGFRLDPETARAITTAAARLDAVSAERVRDELVKLLAGPQPHRAIQMMQETGLLPAVLPEIAALDGVEQSAPHHEPVLGHTISVLRWLVPVEQAVWGEGEVETALAAARRQLAPYAPYLQTHLARHVVGELTGLHLLRFGALFHDSGKAETQRREANGRIRFFGHDEAGARLTAHRLKQLRFSKEAAQHVQAIVATHMRPLLLSQEATVSRRAAFRFFRTAGSAGLDVGLLSLADHLATYDGAGSGGSWESLLAVISRLFRHYFEHYEETIVPRPLIDGNELIAALELEPGPEVGRLLRLLEEAQAAGQITSPEEALALARQARRP
jgi:putative nucleotidyltransferase with HDIG domain